MSATPSLHVAPDTPGRAARPPLAISCSGDPRDPTTFSGLPYAFLQALEARGHDVVPIRTALPPAVHEKVVGVVAHVRARRFADLARMRGVDAARRRDTYLCGEIARVRTATSRRELRRHREVAGVIQWGAGEFLPPAGVPHVLVHDQTFVQAARYPWGWLDGVAPATIEACIARDREMHHRVHAVCALTHWAARSAIEDHGVPPERVHVVGIGRNYEPADLPRDWSVPRFLFVGFDWERKNGPRVVRAFARLREEHPDATLTLVGGHPEIDAPGVTGLGRLELNAPATVERMGELLATSTCMVLPSECEPAGTVFGEALGAGMPSIGTTAGGTETVIGDAGRVVDPHDEEGLLAAMRELAHPATAAALGEVARRRAPDFTWDAVAERLVRALDLPGADDDLAAFL